MKSKLLITALLTFVILVTGCAPATEETPASVATPLIPETGATATEPVTETELPATEAATATQASETPVLEAGPDVTVMVSNEGATPFLIDGQGRSLYVYE